MLLFLHLQALSHPECPVLEGGTLFLLLFPSNILSIYFNISERLHYFVLECCFLAGEPLQCFAFFPEPVLVFWGSLCVVRMQEILFPPSIQGR